MKEIFTMWRHTQMVVLVALSAAIYAAVLIPFKGFTIVPGYIEIRPANAFPVVFGLLFGPASASMPSTCGRGAKRASRCSTCRTTAPRRWRTTPSRSCSL